MIKLILILALQLTPIPFDPIPSPTPVATSTPIALPTVELPTGPVIDYLATAKSNLRQAPADLRSHNGVPLVPDESGMRLFSYAKWLMSANVAAELFGPFAPLFTVVSVTITMLIVFVAGQFLFFIISHVLRFATWIWKRIVEAIQSVKP